MEFLQKRKRKKEIPYDPAIPPLGIYLKETRNTNSKRSAHVHASIIYNGQDMETT